MFALSQASRKQALDSWTIEALSGKGSRVDRYMRMSWLAEARSPCVAGELAPIVGLPFQRSVNGVNGMSVAVREVAGGGVAGRETEAEVAPGDPGAIRAVVRRRGGKGPGICVAGVV